jgi:galactokinase/mevalonate kinase-like predicted kinase
VTICVELLRLADELVGAIVDDDVVRLHDLGVHSGAMSSKVFLGSPSVGFMMLALVARWTTSCAL